MKKIRLPGNPKLWLPLAILYVIMVLILPRSARFNYDFKKGSPWKYETLVAQFDFPILKTQDQIDQEKAKAGSSVIPYYRYSEEIVNSHLRNAEAIDLGHLNVLKDDIVSAVKDIYGKGVVSDDGLKLDKSQDISSEVLFIQKDKRANKYPVTEIYKESDARAKLLATMSDMDKNVNFDSLFRKTGVYDLIVPNLIFDKQTTELVHAESADYISPTQGFVNAGQLLVSKGEIVTAEIEQMLDSYKVEYEANMGYGGPKVLFWLGNAILAFILVIILYLAIFFTDPLLFKDFNRYIYLLMISLLATVGALLLQRINPTLLYMFPFSISALYLMAFFKKRIILPVYILSLLPLLIFCNDGIVLFVMFMVAGMVTILAFKYFNRGWKQFITALFVFISLVVTYFAFRLLDNANGNVYTALIYLFISALLTVAGYPLIYLFERIFSLVSNSKLMELCDTNNELLRKLEHVAPGTFQHCLQVMNMSDAAARSIGANALLTRTGALYHDIGKMANPQCFIENESLVPEAQRNHYHQNLTPRESAKAIIRHVNDGLAIADQYKLPSIVKDFISTHHGTTCTGYFYNQYLNEGGDPSDTADFYYNGKKPTTKEQVIVMLCDTIEAASRTLKDYSPQSFSDFVERMVATKMSAGQFENADISIKELNIIKREIKAYLSGVYHERVDYPKVDKPV